MDIAKIFTEAINSDKELHDIVSVAVGEEKTTLTIKDIHYRDMKNLIKVLEQNKLHLYEYKRSGKVSPAQVDEYIRVLEEILKEL